jgi:hypothetical protein
VCRYKEVILPYYRFKMELVSIFPYAVLYYEVISNFEGQTIMDFVKGKVSGLGVYINVIYSNVRP